VRAAVLRGAGGPEVLEVRQVPDPTFGPEEVLVRVRAAGLNRADLLQRRGLYPPPPGAPSQIPGIEFAGEVEQVGERVAMFRPGDRVMGILGGGGHAERVALHERLCLPVPPGLGWVEAAALPEVFLTAFDALFVRGRLAPGESVLLQAAASGVGTAAAQIVAATGARAIALSRSPHKRRQLAAFAPHVLDPASPDLVEAVRAAAGGDGVDVVLDLVGASALALHLAVLAPLGRLVLVGTLGGSTESLDLSLVMRKRLTLVGTVLRSRPLEEKIALVQAFRKRMLPLVASGRLRAVVDRALPLEEIASAHGVLDRNESFGKVVLTLS
jgi:NADPH2:quinone reductase